MPSSSKLNDSITYKIFKVLEDDPHISQRSLARTLGVSLGKANYCLNALISKGWVKMRNFKNSSNKAAYAYILTPAGLETKARVTARFLRHKIIEYEKLQSEIKVLKQELEKM